jgi:hypothetical protein
MTMIMSAFVVLLFACVVLFANDYFSYPNRADLRAFISRQVDLVNQHNRYEDENGFIPPERLIDGLSCTIPPDVKTMRQWWLDYTRIEEDVRDRYWRGRGGDICDDYPLHFSTTPTRLEDVIGCHTVAMHNPHPYDGLFVAAKYCPLSAPRPAPTFRIVNQTNYTGLGMNLIDLEVFLPNGSQISATDDRLKFQFEGKGCNFTVLPNSTLVLQFDQNSGDKDCHKQPRYLEGCTGSRWECRYVEWVCYNPHCKFTVEWNWANPVINSSKVSEWLTLRYHPTGVFIRIDLYRFSDLR